MLFPFAGIVHSDLKPANFVIVNASLKLIDFGIANRIQPDVTSIMTDSQVRRFPNGVCYTLNAHKHIVTPYCFSNKGGNFELYASWSH